MANMTRNYIDGFWAANSQRGMGRYVQMFSETQNKTQISVKLWGFYPKILSYVIYVIWEQLILQVVAKCKGARELTYAYNSPPIVNLFGMTSCLILHDLIFLEHVSEQSLSTKLINLYRRLSLRYGLRNISCVYCVSHATATQFVGQFGYTGKVIVSPNRIKLSQYLQGQADVFFADGSDVLNVCVITGIAPSKNLPFTLKLAEVSACRRLNVIFHIVGVRREQLSDVHENVTLYENVAEDVKNGLISCCDVLLFPSLQEGFGIPLIEAGLLKTPILCSDIGVFHEVCGDNADYFDPTDVEACYAALTEMHRSKILAGGDDARDSVRLNALYLKCREHYVY